MSVIDLIGAYILFKSSEIDKNLGPDYFQVYVDGINLHYNAYLEGIRQEFVAYKGQSILCYSCKKNNYHITEASYSEVTDLGALLEVYYSQNKGEQAANLLYRFPETDESWYLTMERDFLSGNAMLPADIRRLQSVSDRFEFSVFGIGDDFSIPKKSARPESPPYSYFYFEEIVTAAPFDEKERAYSEWQRMIEPRSIYERMILFCSKKCLGHIPSKNEITLSSVIEAFPGAVSPFAIRKPINDESYHKAALAYSESDFSTAADILRETVDNEGITGPILNLLGASYRFLGQPEKALPYLLLCLKLDPRTPYMTGNLFLCLKELRYKHIQEIQLFLSKYCIDTWSKEQLT